MTIIFAIMVSSLVANVFLVRMFHLQNKQLKQLEEQYEELFEFSFGTEDDMMEILNAKQEENLQKIVKSVIKKHSDPEAGC